MPYVNGILGKIARDPQMKSTKNGKQMCLFTVANQCGYGEHKTTDYIQCMAWEKTGEMIAKHFKKGDPIIVEGEMHNSPWRKDEKGYDIQNWQLTVRNIVFVPKVYANNDDDELPDYSAPAQQTRQNSNSNSNDGFIESMDEDIPF